MFNMKLIILFIWFIDVLSIWIFLPALPDLASFFNVSWFMIALSISIYSLFSFLFAPILWQLADKFGRKPILLISVVWTFLSSILMAITNNFWIFLLARLINWATWWNISIIQSILSDISKDEKERAINLWYIWMLFWLAFIIWPLLGAILLNFWIKAIFYVMVLLSFIEILLVKFFLKETVVEKNDKKIEKNPFVSIKKYFTNKNVNYWIISFFIVIFSFTMYQEMLPLFLEKEFWLSGQMAWYILAWAGIVAMLNQWFLLKKVWLKYFKIDTLVILSNVLIFVFMILLWFTSNIYIFLLLFYSLVMIQWIFTPIYTSEIIQNVWKQNVWEVLWVMNSLRSIWMTIWPVFAGYLIDHDLNIFLVAWIIMIWSLVLVFRRFIKVGI